jgi:hypothetical protein
MIGVNQQDVMERINSLVPDYMAMGDSGMADMGEMHMALPENTLPMMNGEGPYGALAMGGMVSLLKVREGLARGDYRDPGWYQHPAGTMAREWTGEVPEAAVDKLGQGSSAPDPTALKVQRSAKHSGGHEH